MNGHENKDSENLYTIHKRLWKTQQDRNHGTLHSILGESTNLYKGAASVPTAMTPETTMMTERTKQMTNTFRLQ